MKILDKNWLGIGATRLIIPLSINFDILLSTMLRSCSLNWIGFGAECWHISETKSIFIPLTIWRIRGSLVMVVHSTKKFLILPPMKFSGVLVNLYSGKELLTNWGVGELTIVSSGGFWSCFFAPPSSEQGRAVSRKKASVCGFVDVCRFCHLVCLNDLWICY